MTFFPRMSYLVIYVKKTAISNFTYLPGQFFMKTELNNSTRTNKQSNPTPHPHPPLKG
jgi:hypothetical protein